MKDIILRKKPSAMNENELAEVVIEICFRIHRKYGQGLFERVYETLLVHHLRQLGFYVEQQKAFPFEEDGVQLGIGFRMDVLVEKKLCVELKSVERHTGVFFKTVKTYLVLTHIRLGLLINFGEALLKDGIMRIVNGLPDDD